MTVLHLISVKNDGGHKKYLSHKSRIPYCYIEDEGLDTEVLAIKKADFHKLSERHKEYISRHFFVIEQLPESSEEREFRESEERKLKEMEEYMEKKYGSLWSSLSDGESWKETGKRRLFFVRDREPQIFSAYCREMHNNGIIMSAPVLNALINGESLSQADIAELREKEEFDLLMQEEIALAVSLRKGNSKYERRTKFVGWIMIVLFGIATLFLLPYSRNFFDFIACIAVYIVTVRYMLSQMS